MPTVNNVTRVQGDTYPVEVTINDSSGNAMDLTGVVDIKLGIAPKSALKADETASAILDGTVVTPLTGKATFTVTVPAAALSPKEYYAEIQFIKGGFIYTTNQFKFTITGQIVR